MFMDRNRERSKFSLRVFAQVCQIREGICVFRVSVSVIVEQDIISGYCQW